VGHYIVESSRIEGQRRQQRAKTARHAWLKFRTRRLRHVTGKSGLGQALRLAHKDPLIKRVPNIRRFPEETVRQGFFEYTEVVALVNHLPKYLQDFVWFAYYSGWRKNEIARLDWRDVDLKAGRIRLRPEISKNAEGWKSMG
jgi:integrase